MGCWLRMASTSHSGSDIDTSIVITTEPSAVRRTSPLMVPLERVGGHVAAHGDPAPHL
jgi:hypothetical protein